MLNGENIIASILVVTVVLFFKGFGLLLRLFKAWIRKKAAATPKLYVEDFLYKNIYAKQVKPLYAITQCSFKYCMQHKLLERKDILEFKAKLNECVNPKDYKHEKFKNDCHEIYRKLKSTSISPKQMQALNEFLQPFIAAEPKQITYGNLTIVK